VTFTARVTAASGKPTGIVTFKDGHNILGHAPLDNSGAAAVIVAKLSAGPHKISATYDGDNTFISCTGVIGM
jgi:hypothetical protein